MSEEDMPPWDGGPDREVPDWAITNGLDLVLAFTESELPGLYGEAVAEVLKRGALGSVAAGDISGPLKDDQAMVHLWLPFFDDQRAYNYDQEPLTHQEIPTLLRWRDTELAIAALSVGAPRRPVELCFMLDGQPAVALPWFEYGYHYDLPPEYVLGRW